MSERNAFQGAATETPPPDATFDLAPVVGQTYPPGLGALYCALAVVVWACAPAVVWACWRWAL